MADQSTNDTTALYPSSIPGNRKRRGALVVIGGILIHLTFGSTYTFGNMTPYITSYMRVNGVSDVSYAVSTWIISAEATGEGLAMFLGGLLERRFGPRVATFIGCFIFSAGVSIAYFTINASFGAILVTYGLMSGLGKGFGYAVPLACAMRWFPDRKGLVSGLVVGGIGGGAFIFDQIQTAYVNPLNKKPELQYKGESDRYFNQKDILSRVPICFLMLGGLYACLQIIGVIMMTNPPGYTYYEEEISVKESVDKLEGVVSINRELSKGDHRETVQREFKPSAMLKTWAFYNLWLMLLSIEQAIVFVSSLWKAYGQTFIHDDRFLAYVGAFSSVGNAAGRVLWGYIGDKTSFKVAQLSVCTSLAVFILTLVFTPFGGKPFFFIWVFLIFLSFSGTFSLLPAETARAFGSKYYTINYGLMCSADVKTFVSTVWQQDKGFFWSGRLPHEFILAAVLH
ncbi:uncharacterized MFS-type transporter YhjX-like [Liolophura sinensis]|uniref:uncharacterized MFS-type transporter YhjX-like n=1 Tax=Liolophura sinensis TaxID=3198878 RepID=UPI003158C999